MSATNTTRWIGIGLSTELDTFMMRYKPDLLFTQYTTDYEFQSYIKAAYEKYIRLKLVMGELKKADE